MEHAMRVLSTKHTKEKIEMLYITFVSMCIRVCGCECWRSFLSLFVVVVFFLYRRFVFVIVVIVLFLLIVFILQMQKNRRTKKQLTMLTTLFEFLSTQIHFEKNNKISTQLLRLWCAHIFWNVFRSLSSHLSLSRGNGLPLAWQMANEING